MCMYMCICEQIVFFTLVADHRLINTVLGVRAVILLALPLHVCDDGENLLQTMVPRLIL